MKFDSVTDLLPLGPYPWKISRDHPKTPRRSRFLVLRIIQTYGNYLLLLTHRLTCKSWHPLSSKDFESRRTFIRMNKVSEGRYVLLGSTSPFRRPHFFIIIILFICNFGRQQGNVGSDRQPRQRSETPSRIILSFGGTGRVNGASTGGKIPYNDLQDVPNPPSSPTKKDGSDSVRRFWPSLLSSITYSWGLVDILDYWLWTLENVVENLYPHPLETDGLRLKRRTGRYLHVRPNIIKFPLFVFTGSDTCLNTVFCFLNRK